ncbi:MAG: UDP-N-acetylmuramate dehydrogenase [Puniceicoccales bacterium]|jgi:UDP-N-acetylenolpyruvoylglucosamine reductase|nr:UDP-N-acetylmuramate dehydrogenase [Puniceicoccales bacterium]
MKNFFAGIGGAGMLPLALFLRDLGEEVLGFDDHLDRRRAFLLKRAGVETLPRPRELPACDRFVHTAALRRDDALFLAARRREISIKSRGECLADVLQGQRLIAVVGSHGKTTTTAMLIHLLRSRGFGCNFLLGGLFADNSPPGRHEGAAWTVAEIDESEPSFELFSPDITLALNLSMDHEAYHGTEQALQSAFLRFFDRTQGRIFFNGDHPFLRTFLGKNHCSPIEPLPDGLCPSGTTIYNRFNAAAARMVADFLCPAPFQFPSVAVHRRQSVLMGTGSVRVVADYAHHPTEIAAFLREFSLDRCQVIFQPHRYSRTARHFDEFFSVLATVPSAVLLPTYAAYEPYLALGAAERLAAALAIPFLGGGQLLEKLPVESKQETTLLFVGAGPIHGLAEAHARRIRDLFFTKLCRRGDGSNFRENVPLAPLTTLQIGGPARFFSEPDSTDALRMLLANAERAKLPKFLLGNGSKLLVDDGGFSGLAIRLRGPCWEYCLAREDELLVGAGLMLSSLARFCAEHGIGGYEFCLGIPGTVGGAVRMNAGAFGGSIGAMVRCITYLDGNGELRKTSQIPFRYRSWGMPSDSILLEASLSLPNECRPVEEILQKQKELVRMRRERQPTGASAGSIFRNPPGGRPAWELISEAGLRGLRRGGAEISSQHANFIVNVGGACGDDVLGLIFHAKREVERRFAVDLLTEVEYLSDHWVGQL